MKFITVLVVITLLSLASAQAVTEQQCNMLEIAEQAIAKKYPRFDLKKYRRHISENDSFFELTYELPDNYDGGVPIVTIDKRTCKVVHIIHTQ